MSLGLTERTRTLLIFAVNFVFFGLLVVTFALGVMKFLSVSGTSHPQTLEYHVTVYLPYFVAVPLIAVLWSKFQTWSGQKELVDRVTGEYGGDDR